MRLNPELCSCIVVLYFFVVVMILFIAQLSNVFYTHIYIQVTTDGSIKFTLFSNSMVKIGKQQLYAQYLKISGTPSTVNA